MLAVTAYPIIYAFVLSLQRADLRFPRPTSSSASTTTAPSSARPCGGRTFAHADHHGRPGVDRARARHGASPCVMHRVIFGRGPVRADRADPLRHRHRRGRVLVALRLGGRLRLDPAPAGTSERSAARDLRQLHRDHHLRGLEDDAVHGAAAARRPGARTRRAARGGQGRRRHDLAALLADHDPADEAGDPRRAAVPHARRVPHLRHRRSSSTRARTAPRRCRSWPTTSCSTA